MSENAVTGSDRIRFTVEQHLDFFRRHSLRTIVAGSRDGIEPEDVARAYLQCPWPISCVLAGGARGTDWYAEGWAREIGIPVKVYPADWSEYPRRKDAGYRRNCLMADRAQALLAVWDGVSNDTAHMIEIATSRGLHVHIYEPEASFALYRTAVGLGRCSLCGCPARLDDLYLPNGNDTGWTVHRDCHAQTIEDDEVLQLPPAARSLLSQQVLGDEIFARVEALARSESTVKGQDPLSPDFSPNEATIAGTAARIEAANEPGEHIPHSALLELVWPGLPRSRVQSYQRPLNRIAAALVLHKRLARSFSPGTEPGWRTTHAVCRAEVAANVYPLNTPTRAPQRAHRGAP